jgi:hypothetical protein
MDKPVSRTELPAKAWVTIIINSQAAVKELSEILARPPQADALFGEDVRMVVFISGAPTAIYLDKNDVVSAGGYQWRLSDSQRKSLSRLIGGFMSEPKNTDRGAVYFKTRGQICWGSCPDP